MYWKIRPTFGPGSCGGQSLSRHKRVCGRFWCEYGFFNANLHNILVGRNNVPAKSKSTELQILDSNLRPFSSRRFFMQHAHCKMLGSHDVSFCHDVHRQWKLHASAPFQRAPKFSTATLRIHSPDLFPTGRMGSCHSWDSDTTTVEAIALCVSGLTVLDMFVHAFSLEPLLVSDQLFHTYFVVCVWLKIYTIGLLGLITH